MFNYWWKLENWQRLFHFIDTLQLTRFKPLFAPLLNELIAYNEQKLVLKIQEERTDKDVNKVHG